MTGGRRGGCRLLVDRVRTSKALLPSQRYALLRNSARDPELHLSESEDGELDTALIGRGREDAAGGPEDGEDGDTASEDGRQRRQDGGVGAAR